jgi:hypothetical protein
MTDPTYAETARTAASAALKLASLIDAAAEIQWQPSNTPKPREDTTERSRGGHSDPTLNVVADERRLALREAVTVGADQLTKAARILDAVGAKLEVAIDDWHGQYVTEAPESTPLA